MIDKKIAYISYDGMLEPLGHSQVLNYLKLLSKEFSFFIISFEKKNDLKNKKNFNYVNNLIRNHNIYWEKIVYSKNYFLLDLGILSPLEPFLAKNSLLWDLEDEL